MTVRQSMGFSLVALAFVLVPCSLFLVGCEQDEIDRYRALNNHAKHVGLNMDCAACHTGARDEIYAGLPSIRKCAFCHRPDRSEPPTPPELAKYIEAEKEIPWLRVNRLPGHVYFSHAAHVKYGEIECDQCHGKMIKDPVRPAERPLVRPPDMYRCIACHRQRQVSNDCLICHK